MWLWLTDEKPMQAHWFSWKFFLEISYSILSVSDTYDSTFLVGDGGWQVSSPSSCAVSSTVREIWFVVVTFRWDEAEGRRAPKACGSFYNFEQNHIKVTYLELALALQTYFLTLLGDLASHSIFWQLFGEGNSVSKYSVSVCMYSSLPTYGTN